MIIKYHDPRFASTFLSHEHKAKYPEQYKKVLDSLDSDDLGLLLHSPHIRCDSSLLHTLIDLGANFNIQISSGETPLHDIAKYGGNYACKTLIEAGADLEAQDKIRLTPLHTATIYQQFGIMETLIKAGANIHATTHYRHTPLHHAASYGLIHAAKLLLKLGASKDARDIAGRTAWDMTQSHIRCWLPELQP
jgi:ankyrin